MWNPVSNFSTSSSTGVVGRFVVVVVVVDLVVVDVGFFEGLGRRGRERIPNRLERKPPGRRVVVAPAAVVVFSVVVAFFVVVFCVVVFSVVVVVVVGRRVVRLNSAANDGGGAPLLPSAARSALGRPERLSGLSSMVGGARRAPRRDVKSGRF